MLAHSLRVLFVGAVALGLYACSNEYPPVVDKSYAPTIGDGSPVSTADGGDSSSGCMNGQSLCVTTSPYCANLQTDPNNCGACGKVCGGGDAGDAGAHTCTNGQCPAPL